MSPQIVSRELGSGHGYRLNRFGLAHAAIQASKIRVELTNLGSQSLEQSTGSLVLDQVPEHGSTGDLALEVGVLDSGLS